MRCVGIGNCRKTGGGVMCPSYMVTREEKHSTRGRARLLWEMLNGDELPLWSSPDVLEALDLCLACKGCTNECPVNVDMPTLKAEYLAHHYAHRLRPRSAYAFGLIDRWARIAAIAPGLANVFTQTPVVSRAAKAAAGVAPERRLPPFSRVTLQAWAGRREARAPGARRVVLWPDTFTNYFASEIGASAVQELEAAGFSVLVPRQHVCCGRPLYDYGFLDLARRYLERTLRILRSAIRAGVPLVGVEPSCVAVFRDELTKMLPHDEDAQRLSAQTFHLAEFLDGLDHYEPPRLERELLVHGHCHQAATRGVEPAHRLLERMGATVHAPDAGCCGMAGAWGYEQAHYDVSIACGERALLPAVREAAAQTLRRQRRVLVPAPDRAGRDRPPGASHGSGPRVGPDPRPVRPCRRVPGALRPSASAAVPPAGRRRAALTSVYPFVLRKARRTNVFDEGVDMGIGVSLILIAAGAILTWAVEATVSGVNIHTVGVILMVVGVVGLVISLVFWSSWGAGAPGRRRTTTIDEAPPGY